jgi:predicted RNA-binding Zn-ribbon protein involved in translation (DUF1610 family)
MNIRTFRKLTLPIPFLAILIAVGVISPNSRWAVVSGVASLLLVLCYAPFAVYIGVLQLRQKLYFDCPFCGTRSKVFAWGKNRLSLDCPQCGEIAATLGPFRFRYEKVAVEK